MDREAITKKKRVRGSVQLQARMIGGDPGNDFLEHIREMFRKWHRVGWYSTPEVATEAGEQYVRKHNQNNRNEKWEFRVVEKQ